MTALFFTSSFQPLEQSISVVHSVLRLSLEVVEIKARPQCVKARRQCPKQLNAVQLVNLGKRGEQFSDSWAQREVSCVERLKMCLHQENLYWLY